MAGPNSRATQIFISYGAIPSLGRELWETPLGTVIEGMEYVKEFYGGYGDENGPLQHKIRNQGIDYIKKDFPLLDSLLLCTVKRQNSEMIDDLDLGAEEEEEEQEEEEEAMLDDDQPLPKEAIIPEIDQNERKQLRADVITSKNDSKITTNIIPTSILLFIILFIVLAIRNRNK